MGACNGGCLRTLTSAAGRRSVTAVSCQDTEIRAVRKGFFFFFFSMSTFPTFMLGIYASRLYLTASHLKHAEDGQRSRCTALVSVCSTKKNFIIVFQVLFG